MRACFPRHQCLSLGEKCSERIVLLSTRFPCDWRTRLLIKINPQFFHLSILSFCFPFFIPPICLLFLLPSSFHSFFIPFFHSLFILSFLLFTFLLPACVSSFFLLNIPFTTLLFLFFTFFFHYCFSFPFPSFINFFQYSYLHVFILSFSSQFITYSFISFVLPFVHPPPFPPCVLPSFLYSFLPTLLSSLFQSIPSSFLPSSILSN